ncbi:MAG: class II aldolase/adducin family protein [Oscillospiraceae bacterium]|jgi:L-fuculose-phosphate aldolase|nr:class II aldolase/adducin family protein [Oscillospiraceae bacterium]
MDITEAKQAVIAAGLKLAETGLIARTWGNVSCRVDAETFVITPSGKAYDRLTEEDIVAVKIEDCAYEGDVKPSSEKAIHSAAYKLRPDVGFVIHTHQFIASIAGLAKAKAITEIDFWQDILGGDVPIAKYGLPGTGKLKKAVTASLKKNEKAKAVLMAHHGALCVGRDAEAAFRVANHLEAACQTYLAKQFLTKSGQAANKLSEIRDAIAAKLSPPEIIPLEPYDSFRSGTAFVMLSQDSHETFDITIKEGRLLSETQRVIPQTAELHRTIYAKDKSVKAIRHKTGRDIQLTSLQPWKKLKAYLDDFAQIAGTNIKFAEFNPLKPFVGAKAVFKALKGRNAVILKGNGALCTGSSLDEADAVAVVTAKNCAAADAASFLPKVKAIGALDALLMRLVYKLKYSKQK